MHLTTQLYGTSISITFPVFIFAGRERIWSGSQIHAYTLTLHMVTIQISLALRFMAVCASH